ncbi:M28 family metallopeptidase [Pseudonocardia endophytica]|uniref:Zn-dependent M28 family amino/carboxypeptidase n=1 Tax=Pseudonocardia endophytica TaxID=401976 RepID=A0A4R1HSR0_PSEEN|nr:M28 family metallopeptidase [Pseudonocardia endophytica]TCK20432.1 Zn-dependent M28 family amino/carboxypeptidase [Pseudonocardia endophytica]
MRTTARHVRTTATTAFLAAGLVLLAACSDAAPPPGPAAPAAVAADPGLPSRLAGQVSGRSATTHLQSLERIADANGGNRASGTPGYDASVDYVVGVLRQAGYDVQTPTFEARTFSTQSERLTLGNEPVRATALGFSPATPPAGITAPIVVIPPAPQDPTPGCDASDYAQFPRGAVALVQRGVCPFGQKSQLAGAAGAAAVIVANTDDTPIQATLGETPGVVPSASVTRTDGGRLAARAGTPVTLTLATTIRQITSRNVVAQTRTGDPAKVVTAGAHLDSVPEGPGINDDGSGTAALLEIATRMGASPPVGQAVRFAWWGAEEAGLVGSTKYVEGLSEADRRAIAVYLNFDMVGSPNPGYLAYDGDNSDNVGEGPGPPGSGVLEQVLVDGLAAVGVRAQGTDFDGRSDYGPFIEAGIPSGGLFTGAEENKTAEQAQLWGGEAGRAYDPCYHQRCDRVSNVDQVAFDRNVKAMATGIGRFGVSLDGIPPR